MNDKSQGSVAPCLKCGNTFDYKFTAEFSLKDFSKSVNIWQLSERMLITLSASLINGKW